MGILSSPPSEPAVAAAAAAAADAAADAAAEKAVGVSTTAETAITSVPSGATELESTEPCPQLDASDEEPQATPTWGSSSGEKQNLSETNADGVHAFEDQCASGNEEQQLQQQQQDTNGSVKKEGSVFECAACGKEQTNGVIADDETQRQICDACSSKMRSDSMQHELQGEEAIEPNPQKEEAAPVATTALEDAGATPQRRHTQTEGADETSAKTAAAARSSSSSSSSSGSSAASSRVRGASGLASSSSAAATAGAAAPGAAFPSAAGGAAAPRKCIDEGSVRRHVVPVGPRHQVPCLPPFFLENSGFGCCCGEASPALDPSLTAKLVYSPSSLERVRQRRLAEGLADRAICTEGDMEAFMQQCAKNWKGNKPGWQPFSPEFAFKLLHYAGYDPAKALQLMEDPQFSFQLVCDGPVRRYDNKWRPKDRRGVISPTPYPPPVFLRGYLSRRHYRDSTGYSLR
ncbi:uncharacterized protein EMH_0096900 [Eimeria mitis]|uniref:ELM2 domain-containing protein n=1 Tax=Eimeria mitis TaxID=44415 RepID=U6JR95_9EIME|nr:uncharacterized protein EMH_0096900 [Eimeria mitis]CDJ27959.1 hypothetical protein, conserved [Eimeria mitis]